MPSISKELIIYIFIIFILGLYLILVLQLWAHVPREYCNGPCLLCADDCVYVSKQDIS